MSRGRQTLIGCGLGCLALALLAGGSCVAFTVWMNRPGDVLEPERLLASEATGYVEWTLRLEDPGAKEFFELLLAELQAAGRRMPSGLPPALEGPLLRMQQKRNEKKLRRLFPMVLVWTVEPRTDAGDDYLLSASFRGLDHQLRFADFVLGWLLGFDEDARIVPYRGERIYLLDRKRDRGPIPVFIRQGDLFFTTDEASARRALDRLDAPPLAESPPVLAPLLRDLPDGSLRGAISNDRGEVWRAWRRFLDEELPDELDAGLRDSLRSLALSGHFDEEGVFRARLAFHFGAAEAADRAREAIRASIEELVSEGPIEVAGEKVVGPLLAFDLEVEVREIPIPRGIDPAR